MREVSSSGKVVILSGPSGCGKSTICRRLLEMPRVWLSVSATTRARRPGEVDGVDYYFLSREEFERRIAEGKFIEYAYFFDNYYGTPIEPVLEKVAEGYICVLEIDICGQEILKRKGVSCISIFIAPPSLEVLEQRLRARSTEGEAEIAKRLGRAREEMERASLYDYVVVNDDLDRAVEEVYRIISC